MTPWIYLYAWLALALIGTPVLYIGFGFAMAAKRARDEGRSQKIVQIIDGAIVVPFVILDAALNVLVCSALMLDFRPGHTLTLVTERFSRYALDPDERAFRRWAADVLAAFLDGKDPDGDHIKGANQRFAWLD